MKSPPHIHTLLKSNVPGNLIIQSWERLAQIIKQKPSSELLGTMQNYDLVKHIMNLQWNHPNSYLIFDLIIKLKRFFFLNIQIQKSWQGNLLLAIGWFQALTRIANVSTITQIVENINLSLAKKKKRQDCDFLVLACWVVGRRRRECNFPGCECPEEICPLQWHPTCQ